jgi:hypothetical protein
LPTYEQFFRDAMGGAGIRPNLANLRAAAVVAICEGLNRRWNPWNLARNYTVPGSTDYNTAGVQTYPDYKSGVDGHILYLTADRNRWVKYLMQRVDSYRYIILHEFETKYAAWGSRPDFYGVSGGRADTLLATQMTGPA